MNVFEYGSGSSTLWWSKLGANVISVEHDEHWIAIINAYLNPNDRVQIHLVGPDESPQSESVDLNSPYSYRTRHKGFEGVTFKAYASVIDRYPDTFFDVILVDGQARPACVRHALPKLSRNGLLIVDNTNVTSYLADAMPLLDGFRRVSFRGLAPIDGALSQTDLFFASLKN